MQKKLMLGAVAYDPKVVTIWDGFQRFFESQGLPFDYVLFTNYEQQVLAHFDGVIDVAWNSPLAWVQTRRIAERVGRKAQAIAMRDTDMDLTSAVVVRADAPMTSPRDLEGRRIGFGASDSPQATLLPRSFLRGAGVSDATLDAGRLFDVLVGKHGDHVGGERDAARALASGELDAACVLDANVTTFGHEGIWRAGTVRVLARTPPYDHCNFTVLDGAPGAAIERFGELLLAMSYEDHAVRPLLDLEGLKAWRPGRTSGYALLEEAVPSSGPVAAFIRSAVARRVR